LLDGKSWPGTGLAIRLEILAECFTSGMECMKATSPSNTRADGTPESKDVALAGREATGCSVTSWLSDMEGLDSSQMGNGMANAHTTLQAPLWHFQPRFASLTPPSSTNRPPKAKSLACRNSRVIRQRARCQMPDARCQTRDTSVAHFGRYGGRDGLPDAGR